MRIAPALIALALALSVPARPQSDPPPPDPRIGDALFRLSREASALWQTAPRFLGREHVYQKAFVRHRRIGVGAGRSAQPMAQVREITSYYNLGAMKAAPEAVTEFRHILQIDSKQIDSDESARARFQSELQSGDPAKESLRKAFEKACLAGAATDFGQLILLFTKSNIEKYSYSLIGDGRAGVDPAWVLAFEQQTGEQSLRLNEGRHKSLERLHGEIWTRQGDFLPLRIVLNSKRTRGEIEIRDEARVDYTALSGALLPESLVYRRYVSGEMMLESIYKYSEWKPIDQK